LEPEDISLMNTRRILTFVPIVVVALLLQSYFWVPTYEEQTRGNPYRLKEFITGSIGDASILNPILSADSASSDINGLVFEGLLDHDEELRFRGRVATRWEITEEAYFRVHGPAGVRGMESKGPEELARWLKEELRFWDAVSGVELVRDPPAVVRVPVRMEEKGKPQEVDVQVTPPPRIKITLREVDQDFFQKLEPLLGEGYFDAFRPEEHCAFPSGTPEEQRSLLCRQILPPVEHNPVILFHLRPGVKFHDGRPLTAKDVIFTYQAIMDPANLSPRVSDYEPVLRMEAPDPMTVRIVYKWLHSPALGTWGMGLLPEHLLNREALEKEARSRDMDPSKVSVRLSEFNRRPVGCGPFRFESWKSDEFINLKRFEDYWEGAPNYEQYTYRIVPDLLTQEMEFYAGTLDNYGVQPHQVARLSRDPEYQSFSGLSLAYSYIGYNLRREVFRDVRVRRALGMAIDVEKVVRYLLYGQGERTTGPFAKQTDFYDPSVEPLPYDPAEALKLLEDAGWRRDGSGKLTKDGKPLRFTLITNNGNDQRVAILAIAQDAWRQLGIDVQTDRVEWAVFIKERILKNDFDAVVLGWSTGIDPDLYQVWHSSQTAPGQLNFVDFRDAEADDLIIRIRQEYDHDRQVALCRRLHQIIAREQPYTFLYVPKWTAVLDKRIVIEEREPQGRVAYRKITPTKTGSYTFYFNRWVKQPHVPIFSSGG
jgi:ABC-type transport system substrate-binding protein